MGKVALLIGVGEYLPSSGLQNLAAAAQDVAAMQDVLVQPEIGGFAEADVTVLLNPEPQGMREALERLFAGRKADDLVLLYFSGHGVVDDFGTFHLTTARTDKGLLHSTAIPAGFVHGLMEGRGSKRQVVILDCCFSGAFAQDMKAKGEAVDLQPQLGGKGRAVLTSSSATEYSFEQKESVLSVYTQYVVEGLRTGIADGDGDGWISVDELHEFVQGKVQEVAPAMQPKIYPVEEGHKIILAQAPVGDPRLEYRKEVEKLAEQKQGKFSATILMALETKQQRWGLESDTATVIRQEVLRPYEEFAAKCHKYQQAVQQELQRGDRLSQEAWEDLQYLQQTLGLKNENIQPFIGNIEILPTVAEQSKAVPKIGVNQVYQHSAQNSRENTSINTSKTKRSKSRQTSKLPLLSVFLQRAHLLIRDLSAGDLKFLIYGGFFVSIVLFSSVNTVLRNVLGQTTLSSSPINSSPSKESGISRNTNKIAEDFFNKGFEKYNEKDYKGAIEEYGQAINLKSNYAEAYNNRGHAHRRLHNKKAAIEDYNQAIKLKSDYADAYYSRALVYDDLSDDKTAPKDYHKKAIADYQKAADLYPLDNERRREALDAIKDLETGWGT
jgi:uncharacterized caspase-like protein